uniref:Putative e3 ubiquitin-protein ligase n=1 Tax=Corethrella appendiculata TaxID=1370023 RepID=U5EQF7_9DIPT
MIFKNGKTLTYLLFGTLFFISLTKQKVNAAPTNGNKHNIDEHHTTNNNQKPNLDEEVLELELLKHPSKQHQHTIVNTKEEILPTLEKQLETITNKDNSKSSSESEEEVVHEATEKINDDDGPEEEVDHDSHSEAKQSENDELEKNAEKSKVEHHHHHHHEHEEHPIHHQHPPTTDHHHKVPPKPMKLLPGAARLAFGPGAGADLTTTTTTTSTTAIPSSELPVSSHSDNDSSEELIDTSPITNNGQRRSISMYQSDDPNINSNNKNSENAEILLRHSGGQYSAFDMAQYVFWTGDEAGVARAVEELIQEGLMSRENAIKFLRDIRLGIDYLQNTYSSRPFGLTGGENKLKESNLKSPILSSTSTTTTSTTTTEPPVPNRPTISPELLKVIEKLPSLLKINELNERRENAIDYDEMAGRLRLADFLYAEYSLEEVIYQLAKVMFTQSLTRNSETAQTALQKLTGFLELEGAQGRISPTLQKKILDVLLAALSDTLAENPELLTSARLALGDHVDRMMIPNHLDNNKQH